MLQFIRKIVQIFVILAITSISIMSYYGYLLSAKGQKDFMDVVMEEKGHIAGILYGAINKVVSPSPNAADEFVSYIDRFKGGVWSLTVYGFNITDPLAAVIATISGKAFYIPLAISIIIPMVFIFIFGRAFCGWLCPMNLLFELNEKARQKLESFKVPILDSGMDRRYKYVVLFSMLVLSLFGIQLLPYILPYALVSREIYNYMFYSVFSFGMVLILLLLLFELLVSRRGWCRYLCPGGAFFSLLGFIRVVRVDADLRNCPVNCQICTEVCPRGLEPHKNIIGMECDNCGLCISRCPASAVKYRVKGLRVQGFKVFLFFLLFTFCFSLFTVSYAAHSKIINPHAGGDHSTYPQNPSEDYISEKDGYLANFSVFQHKQSDSTIRVKAVAIVKEKTTGEPYLGPLKMVFYRKSLFSLKEDMVYDFKKDFENRYPFYANLPYESDFKVKVSFNNNGKDIEFEFPMRVGEPKSNLIFLGLISAILIASVITIAHLKKKQSKVISPAG